MEMGQYVSNSDRSTDGNRRSRLPVNRRIGKSSPALKKVCFIIKGGDEEGLGRAWRRDG
jgi:hypothetical protein